MPLARTVRDAAVFAPCYIALDWASYIAPLGAFNITPWNPQPALAIAWMLLGGLHHAPVVLATIFFADVAIRLAPGGYAITLLSALCLTAGYSAIAWTLRRLPGFDARLNSVRDVTSFVVTVLAGAALAGGLFVGALKAGGVLPEPSFFEAAARFWLGDAAGILVTAPLLIIVADRERRRALYAFARRPETAAQVIALLAVLWLTFEGLSGDPSRHFYLLFIPLIWIAARGGMIGAVVAMAIVQLGVVAGVHREELGSLPVVELQALVASLTLTSLYLGVMVHERQRANESLRQSLRLAAAGEMAGAIAHEVNQPLTALATYGRSTRLLMEAGRNDEAKAVIDKILAEAQRASEVVRRLRDFFREGTTRLERVSVAELLEAVRRIGAAAKGDSPMTLTVELEHGVPDVLIDRLQIELVLRNLVTNAVDSVNANAPAQGRISVRAARADEGRVRITVTDNGPGVGAAMRGRMFEPFVSGKSSGMGLGLAVSRAIAEAHGGTLEAGAGTHGEFHLVLPAEAPHA